MSVTVSIEVQRQFGVTADPQAVFEVLADVPYSVSHFPRVRHLVDLGDGVYRWELEAIAAAGLRHAVVYACRYVSDAARGSVAWTPVAEVGNGEIRGAWQIGGGPDGARIGFRTEARLQIPAPGLLGPIVTPIVREIFAGLIAEYIGNLRRTFDANG